MTGLIFCLSAVAMGVDYGWQPVAGGGIEYIIQIEPALLDSLKDGRDVFSDLPSSVSNVRRYRITVGSGRLPHHGEPPPASAVVQAGGLEQTRPGRGKTSHAKAAEIDISELPGPVLGPALVLESPTNPGHDDLEEPKHLANAHTAQPIADRTNGLRQPRDDASTTSSVERADDETQSPSVEPTATKTSEKPDLAAANETDSPSDQSPAKSETSPTTKSAMTLIGLFLSVVCNVFFLWVAADQRTRYRALVRRMFDVGSASLADNRDVNLPRWERLPAPEKPGNSESSGETVRDGASPD
jgi:hypothetical protein